MKRIPVTVAPAGFIVFLVILLLSSCSEDGRNILNREKLFSLEYGKMEDQVDLYQDPGVPFSSKTRLYMREGIFFIANGNSNKIMEFTSYGDILSLYYNADHNPDTFLLQRDEEERESANRKAYTYPFQEVGEVAVNSEKEVLVEDKVGESRSEFDPEIGAMLNRVVLRFDKEGELLDYIGQEGVGGTPFPFIHNIHVTERDEIAVVTRSVKHWVVFWYSPRGALLYKLNLSVDNLPVPENENLVPSLSEVTVDQEERLVYLKIEYYGSGEGSLQGRTGSGSELRNIDYDRSLIWFFDIQDERFTGNVEVPVKEGREKLSDFKEAENVRRIYDHIGTGTGGTFFLLAPHDNDIFELLLLKRSGKVIARQNIEIPEKGIHYRDMHVTPKGVLTALFAKDEEVDIVLWRSDKLMEDEDEDSSTVGDGGD
ncbi:MAG: LIC_12708 family protein [Spirochaetaceae bacterium]